MRTLFYLPIALLLYLSLLSKYRADSDEPPCYMAPSAKCAELNSGGKCGLDRDLIFCCNVTDGGELDHFFGTKVSSSDQILGFHLRDSSLEKLGLRIFDKFKRLASFSITNSNITHISDAFDGPNSLTCLNISHNMIVEMHPYILLRLKNLKNIVITNNTNMTVLPEFSHELKGFKLDVSGNLQLSCKYLINLTIADAKETIKFTLNNKNLTRCCPPKSKIFNDKLVYVTMGDLDKVREIVHQCPSINGTEKCECSVSSLDVEENNTRVYHALVNCSHRAMMSLPNKLPSITRVLDISNNNITSFDGIGNKLFSSVRELYADNNKIASLKPLEGTSFLDKFQNLSLRNNKIDQIPVYMLSNVFDRMDGHRIYLAENEFKCDCPTAVLKPWLMANKEHIPDFKEIYTRCGSSRTLVIDLDQKDVCSKPASMRNYIRFVICGEIIIFVLLIGKVSYDYYIFKTFGYLPWPASRMPKLPCDWCFEN